MTPPEHRERVGVIATMVFGLAIVAGLLVPDVRVGDLTRQFFAGVCVGVMLALVSWAGVLVYREEQQ